MLTLKRHRKRWKVPFHVVDVTPADEKAVLAALRSRQWAGNGAWTRRLEEQLQKTVAAGRFFLTPSCTAAMELGLLALDIGPGDEVICPSFSFPSVPNSILLRGARVVFADITPRHCSLDLEDVRRKITRRTRGILAVHYAGMASQWDELLALAKRRRLWVMEDAAQALGSTWQGKALGTFGRIGCFSLHHTKVVTSGEGGLLYTTDEGLIERLEWMQEKGTNRQAFLRGETQKYNWVALGTSALTSDIVAALAYSQVLRLNQVICRRRQVAGWYLQALKNLKDVATLSPAPGCEPNWHLVVIRVPARARDAVLTHLRAGGVEASFHFLPLHQAPYAVQKLGLKSGDCPVTVQVASEIVRLPIWPGMSQSQVHYVVRALARALADVRRKGRL